MIVIRCAPPLLVLAAVAAAAPTARTCAAAAIATRDSMTVEECAALARRSAPAVLESEAERRAAGFDSAAAARNARPAFLLTGSLLLAPAGFYDPAATNLGEYELKARVEWGLADGGARRRERRRAGLVAAGAGLELSRQTREAGLRAALLALELLQLRDKALADREGLAWIDRLADLVTSGRRAGTRGAADVLRLSLERDAVVAALQSTARDSAEALRELADLLHADAATVPPVREPAFLAEQPPGAADSAACLAAAERQPELQAARVLAAERDLDLEDAARRDALHVGLNADAGLWGTDLTRRVPPDLLAGDPRAGFGDRVRRDLGASLGLSVTLPMADAALKPSRLARQADRDAASLGLARITAEQKRRLRDLVGRWRDAATRLALARSAEARADENLVRMKSLYAAGEVSLLELLDARRLLDDARERSTDARFEARAARSMAEAAR